MLFKRKSGLLSALLMALLSLLAGLGVNHAYAETALTPDSTIQSSLSVNDFLATLPDTQTQQSVWLSHNFRLSDNLLMTGASLPSGRIQTIFAYADPSFSGIANLEAPIGDNKINLIAYVPLPTTTWCFLIGVMTLLGMSKRRSAARR